MSTFIILATIGVVFWSWSVWSAFTIGRHFGIVQTNLARDGAEVMDLRGLLR